MRWNNLLRKHRTPNVCVYGLHPSDKKRSIRIKRSFSRISATRMGKISIQRDSFMLSLSVERTKQALGDMQGACFIVVYFEHLDILFHKNHRI